MKALSILTVPVRKLAASHSTEAQDLAAVEEPLEIRIGSRNIAVVTLAAGAALDANRLERNFYVTSSYGVCGKVSIEAIEASGCRTSE